MDTNDLPRQYVPHDFARQMLREAGITNFEMQNAVYAFKELEHKLRNFGREAEEKPPSELVNMEQLTSVVNAMQALLYVLKVQHRRAP